MCPTSKYMKKREISTISLINSSNTIKTQKHRNDSSNCAVMQKRCLLSVSIAVKAYWMKNKKLYDFYMTQENKLPIQM